MPGICNKKYELKMKQILLEQAKIEYERIDNNFENKIKERNYAKIAYEAIENIYPSRENYNDGTVEKHPLVIDYFNLFLKFEEEGWELAQKRQDQEDYINILERNIEDIEDEIIHEEDLSSPEHLIDDDD
jgi:hypothetical protein